MDWAKAKNILIVAFIITNLILGYYVLQDWEANSYSYTVSEDRINDVKEILRKKNIIIKADVPKEVSQIPELTVKYETYDEKKIQDRFLEGNDSDYDKTIRVTANNKLITYQKTIKGANNDLSLEEVRKIAYDFIKKHGYEKDDMKLWDIRMVDNEYEIVYKQKYKDVILDDGYMKINIKNSEVIWFERKWLQPTDIKVIEKRVIPATKALLLAIDELKDKKDTKDSEVIVTDINLVYSLNMYELNGIFDEKWYVGDEKKGLLYWRINLENSDDIDIEAYE